MPRAGDRARVHDDDPARALVTPPAIGPGPARDLPRKAKEDRLTDPDDRYRYRSGRRHLRGHWPGTTGAPGQTMPGVSPRDALIGMLIALAWGLNFVAIEQGLEDLPPLLFVGLRFLLAAVPMIFFIRAPGVATRAVVALGLLSGVGQFGFLFLGVAAGMPAGLSSVVLQVQMPFTVLLAALVLHERPGARQLVGLGLAIAGLVLIAARLGSDIPVGALLLVVVGGASWAGANVLARSIRPASPFSLLVYSSLVAGGCLLVLSLVFDGPHRDANAVQAMGARAVLSLLYIVVVATLAGYAAWYWLLGRYASSTVSAFPLLAPVAALSSTWLLLGETITAAQLAGSALVVGGVAFAIWSSGRGGRAGLAAAADVTAAGAAGR